MTSPVFPSVFVVSFSVTPLSPRLRLNSSSVLERSRAPATLSPSLLSKESGWNVSRFCSQRDISLSAPSTEKPFSRLSSSLTAFTRGA